MALALLTAGGGHARADDTVSVHGSVAGAVEAAADDGAPILLFFYARSSPAADQMLRHTISSNRFAREAGLLHVVRLDVDADPQAARTFRVQGLPETLVMTAEMQIVSRHRGVTDTAGLLAWVEDARERIRRGAWEGTAIGADRDDPQPPDAEALIEQLGEADPAARSRAFADLEQRGSAVVPTLIDALDHDYLGVRLGAAEVLRRVAPNAPPFDPWAERPERAAQREALAQWWSDSPPLATPLRGGRLDPAEARSIDDAVRSLLSDEAVARTAGMTTLVQMGHAALPHVRDALDQAADADQQRAVWVLEDVRWAILVPDALERQHRVRRDLARAASESRQAAAQQLASAGAAALPALRELIDDADPLVREAAAHALSHIGGEDAIAALGVLLGAGDSNLRMVAAQALAETEDRRAGHHLARAVRDEDEVVAATAIAGLEQVEATDQAQALLDCLDDDRWRVRAAAVEALGKMEVRTARQRIAKLLDDEDTFVANAALDALRAMNADPPPHTLYELAQRQPQLRRVIVAVLARSPVPQNVAVIDRLREEAEPHERMDILDGLAQQAPDRTNTANLNWLDLLENLADDDEPAVRRRLAELLQNWPTYLAFDRVEPLLADGDPAVRHAAAALVVRLAAHHHGVNPATAREPGYGLIKGEAADDDGPSTDPADDPPATLTSGVTVGSGTAADQRLHNAVADATDALAAPAVRAAHRRWHDQLAAVVDEGEADTPGDPRLALARFATAPESADALPLVRGVLDDRYLRETAEAPSLILARLPWPQGEDLLMQMLETPELYAAVLRSYRDLPESAQPAVADPARLAAVLVGEGPETGDHAELALRELLDASHPLSPLRPGDVADELVEHLLASDHGLARALAYTAMSHWPRVPVERLAPGLEDDDPWVRYAAADAIGHRVNSRHEREPLLAPLLDDPHTQPMLAAAWHLLTAGVRAAAGVEAPGRQRRFVYDHRQAWVSMPSDSTFTTVNPPARVVQGQPDWLDTVRDRLAGLEDGQPADEVTLPVGHTTVDGRHILELLLAQHGDFSGFERMLDDWRREADDDLPPTLPVALLLTGDDRYIEPLRPFVESRARAHELTEALQWLRGMRGDEARTLRREINARIRQLR